ncbi:MAG: hypothetical protein NVS2B12_32120 [Ktedonobacteraceae bacterium]
MLTKPRVNSQPLDTSMYAPRRRRLSPMMLGAIGVPVVLMLIIGIAFLVPYIASHAAAVNANCSLQVPDDPLTARGLATPYQLFAADPAQGACNEANAGQSAFVQAVIFDPNTNTLSAYEPLVIDRGTQPAVAPMTPQLPRGSIVGIWFGFNGTFLHLTGGVAAGRCVNGLPGSDFGQFAYCNAPQFFRVTNAAVQAHKITIPALGIGRDGQDCPTTRSFAVVDMDQSDNVQTRYLANANGQTAQFSPANQTLLSNPKTMQQAIKLGNPSDNALVSRVLNPALGCSAWQIPNLSNNGTMTATLPTDELQAAAFQKAPAALVPPNDEMVLLNNQPSLMKLNSYRIGVNQPFARTLNDANTTTYCTNILNTALPRLRLDMKLFQAQPSPDGGATANSLFTFLANRLNATLSNGGLNCVGLLNIKNPVTLTTDGNGVVTDATIGTFTAGTGTGTGTGTTTGTVTVTATPTTTGTGTGTGTGTTTGTAPNCNVNGTAIPGCMGTVTINGQSCMLSFAGGIVTETCPAGGTTGTGTGTTTGVGVGTGTVNMNPLNYNNVAISNDNTQRGGNFDGVGFSYSAQALQSAGITPGKVISFNGVNFYWPASAPSTPDNVVAQGQQIVVRSVPGATTLAFLGASGFGPVTGNATITYTDGTTQNFTMAFSDWTLNNGDTAPLSGNQVVATTSYRNRSNGGIDPHMPNIFYMDVTLMAGKTIKSVTLPHDIDHGDLHIFAIGTK